MFSCFSRPVRAFEWLRDAQHIGFRTAGCAASRVCVRRWHVRKRVWEAGMCVHMCVCVCETLAYTYMCVRSWHISTCVCERRWHMRTCVCVCDTGMCAHVRSRLALEEALRAVYTYYIHTLCVYIYICIYIYIYIYIYTSYIHSMCIYIYIYIHIHTRGRTKKVSVGRGCGNKAPCMYVCIIYIYIYIYTLLKVARRKGMRRSTFPATWKHGWSKHGSSIIHSVFEGFMLEPCLLQPCFHVPGIPGRRWKGMLHLRPFLPTPFWCSGPPPVGVISCIWEKCSGVRVAKFCQFWWHGLSFAEVLFEGLGPNSSVLFAKLGAGPVLVVRIHASKHPRLRSLRRGLPCLGETHPSKKDWSGLTPEFPDSCFTTWTYWRLCSWLIVDASETEATD